MYKRVAAVMTVVMTFAMTYAMNVLVWASEPTNPATGYDMKSAIDTGIKSMSTDIMGIISVVVPVVLGIVGAKLAISKGISIFKSLTNKG